MTQKEKLIKSTLFAQRVKSLAGRLRAEARSYDVQFPLLYASEFEDMANEYLKLK